MHSISGALIPLNPFKWKTFLYNSFEASFHIKTQRKLNGPCKHKLPPDNGVPNICYSPFWILRMTNTFIQPTKTNIVMPEMAQNKTKNLINFCQSDFCFSLANYFCSPERGNSQKQKIINNFFFWFIHMKSYHVCFELSRLALLYLLEREKKTRRLS